MGSIQNDIIDIEKVYTEKDLEGLDPFKDLKDKMQSDRCRYILYDCHYATKETKNKDKMCYAASNDSMCKCLSGIKHKLQMNDCGDMSSRGCLAEKLGKDIISLEGHSCYGGDDDN